MTNTGSQNGAEPDPRVPQANDASADATTGLRTKVAGGIRWGFIVSIVTQIGRMAFLIVLMRLLGPRNYGIAGQAAVFIAIAQIFVNFGLAASIVQRARLEESEAGTAFWLNVVMGIALAAATVIAAPWLAAFFRTEELTAVLYALSVCFVLRGMTVVPSALLTRHMRFRGLGVVEIVATFGSGAVGVVAAALGAGYWALVVQAICQEAIYLLFLPMSGLREFPWSSAAARSLWSFSSRVMGADLVNYVSNNGDKFLVARFLGATPLGLYSLAFRVLQLTLSVAAQAGRVVLPTFSRLQEDPQRLTRAFLGVAESVSLAIFPAMTLAILIAPVAVPAVFGEAWIEATVPLQLIAAMTMPYVLLSNMGPLTVAVGKPDWEFRWSVVNAVVSLLAFTVGLQWGIVGLAASYLIVQFVLHAVRFVVIQRLIPISARSYIRALAPASTCSAVLVAAWFLLEVLLEDRVNGLTLIALGSAAGALAYVAAFRFAWPHDFRRQLEFARLVVGGKQA